MLTCCFIYKNYYFRYFVKYFYRLSNIFSTYYLIFLFYIILSTRILLYKFTSLFLNEKLIYKQLTGAKMFTKKTICVQIGNTDNKLTQQKWSFFCRELYDICWSNGTIHFSGAPDTTQPYQNYCVVVETAHNVDLKTLVSKLGERMGQDSIAWLEGDVEFV